MFSSFHNGNKPIAASAVKQVTGKASTANYTMDEHEVPRAMTLDDIRATIQVPCLLSRAVLLILKMNSVKLVHERQQSKQQIFWHLFGDKALFICILNNFQPFLSFCCHGVRIN